MSGALAVFIVSLCALVYTFIGYPLLLAAWSRARPRAVQRAPIEPDVAIVICVYNGAAFVADKIRNCLAQDYPRDALRVLIASDGSSDETNSIVLGLSDPRVTLLAFAQRRGKASCLNDALGACTESVVVLTDVRQKLHKDAVRELLANLADPEVGAVGGQLVFSLDGITPYGESLDVYWRYEKFLRRAESRIASSVGVSGALYALRLECFRPIPADTILDDVLIPMNVAMQGRRVLFEDRALAFDMPSKNAADERKRKVRTMAGNFQLLTSHPRILAPWRNPLAFQFLSHKVARLCMPLAMLGAFIANAVLAASSVMLFAALGLQLLCYALAVAGLLVPAANRWRAVSLASGFVTLNWFVVLGLAEFLFNRNAHLWNSGTSGRGINSAP